MTVQDQTGLLIVGLDTLPLYHLTDDEFMSIYHSGELAAGNGLSVLSSPYLDDPERLPVWMLGYMEQPVVGFGAENP